MRGSKWESHQKGDPTPWQDHEKARWTGRSLEIAAGVDH